MTDASDMGIWPDEEIMERWDVIHQNTVQIAQAMKLTEPGVDQVVADTLARRHAARKGKAA